MKLEINWVNCIVNQNRSFGIYTHNHVQSLQLFTLFGSQGDCTVLLRLDRALVRSKLDYGCFIYRAACKFYISLLDSIQNQGLRISLGAFRTSPAQLPCVEANKLHLHLRREKLALQFVIKIP